MPTCEKYSDKSHDFYPYYCGFTFNFPKREVIKACLCSGIQSINHSDESRSIRLTTSMLVTSNYLSQCIVNISLISYLCRETIEIINVRCELFSVVCITFQCNYLTGTMMEIHGSHITLYFNTVPITLL